MPGVRYERVFYIGSTSKDLKKLPNDVKEVFAHGIRLASEGLSHPKSKPLKGYGGRSVLELIEDSKGATFRGVYTIKFKNVVYVLHVFKKKSHKGISTPKKDRDLIDSRLKYAEAHYKELKK